MHENRELTMIFVFAVSSGAFSTATLSCACLMRSSRTALYFHVAYSRESFAFA